MSGISEIDDRALIDAIVSEQVGQIRAQKQWAHWPLAVPGPAPAQRERSAAMWAEAGRRGLREKINAIVKERIGE